MRRRTGTLAPASGIRSVTPGSEGTGVSIADGAGLGGDGGDGGDGGVAAFDSKLSLSRRTHVPALQSFPGAQSMSSAQVPGARLPHDAASIPSIPTMPVNPVRATIAIRSAWPVRLAAWRQGCTVTIPRTPGIPRRRSGWSAGCTDTRDQSRRNPSPPGRSPGRYRRCWRHTRSRPDSRCCSCRSRCSSRRGMRPRSGSAGRSRRRSCNVRPPCGFVVPRRPNRSPMNRRRRWQAGRTTRPSVVRRELVAWDLKTIEGIGAARPQTGNQRKGCVF